MGKIIICFQKDDTNSIAGRLDDFLSNRFGDANIALGIEKLVKIGEDYSDSIEDRVKASDAFILLIGDRWLTGDWAANPNDYNAIAVNAAINNRKRIIPVLVNNAVFPASSLPESFASLARRMPTTLREEQFRADAAALADSIQEFVAPAPPPTPQPPPVAPAPAAPAPAVAVTAPAPTAPAPAAPQAASRTYGTYPPPSPSSYGSSSSRPSSSGFFSSSGRNDEPRMELATGTRRFVGFLLLSVETAIITYIIQFGVGFLGGSMGLIRYSGSSSSYYQSLSNLSMISLLVASAVVWLYLAIMWGSGQPLSYKMLGIKVVKPNGDKPGFGSGFVRVIGYVLASLPLMLGFIGVITDEKKQGWHDKMANTIVIKTQSSPTYVSTSNSSNYNNRY
ncbi:MAG: RDD family protein [Anaerolineae bacterium]|nr:RDD family protein [Anaerolineae bacterium]